MIMRTDSFHSVQRTLESFGENLCRLWSQEKKTLLAVAVQEQHTE